MSRLSIPKRLSIVTPILALACAACGAAPDEGANAEPLVEETQASINEASCSAGDIPDAPIWAWPPTLFSGTTSPDGNYGVPHCKNAFRVRAYSFNAVSDPLVYLEVSYAGPVTTPSFLGCEAMWVYATLWEWPPSPLGGGTPPGTRIATSPVTQGKEYRLDGQRRCSIPRVRFRPPAGLANEGRYFMVAAQAGAITTYQKVKVEWRTGQFL